MSFLKKQRESAKTERADETAPPVRQNTHPARSFSLRRTATSLVLALFCAMFAFYVGQRFYGRFQESQILIHAREDTGAVTFRGAYVDGEWVSPSDHVPESGGWSYDSEEAVYTAIDAQPLIFKLPTGTDRSLVFTAGPEEGIADVEIDGETFAFDLWNESLIELGQQYALEYKSSSNTTGIINVGVIAFLLTFFFCFIGFRPKAFNQERNREVWQDVLRVFCCFTVVLLHCTYNVYKEFGESLAAWVPHMLMSSFTAFAVPCFYMISGASLLRREQSIHETWRRRIPAAAIPLIFWSVVYIVCSGDLRLKRFLGMFFQSQAPHLWFMYSILGIYALLPLFSKLYRRLDIKGKVYLLVLLLFIPSCLHDAEYLANVYVDMPHFVFFWPDLGLFFWGMFLWEQRDRISKWAKWYPLAFIAGLALTAACTAYTSLRDGTPNQNFISCIGSVGVLGMCSALFAFFVSYRDSLQHIGVKIRSGFAAIAGAAFGIYLIHPLVMELCGWRWINDANLLHMCVAGLVYFVLSALVCLCAKQTRGFEKIV